MLESLSDRAAAHPQLAHRARRLSTRVLIDTEADQFLMTITNGVVQPVERGPFVFPTWDFALRSSAEEWAQFWLPVPPPGHHDLFAMIKRGALRAEGNLHPFMANLRFFKELLALPREEQNR